METWMTVWKVVFIVVLAMFALLSIWVTIGGFKDIRELFAAMDAAQQEAEQKKNQNP